MPQPDWTHSQWADAAKVAAWIDANGHMTGVPHTDSRYSRMGVWRKGGRANVHAIDRMLTSFGRHLSELPDDVWL